MLKWVTKKTVVPERENELFDEPLVLPESDDDPLPVPAPAQAPPLAFNQLHPDFHFHGANIFFLFSYRSK